MQTWPAASLIRAKRDHPHHVKTGPHAAVHQHLHLALDRIGDGRQRPDRGQHAVKLPPAMVADDNAVGTETDRVAGVLRVQDALDDHRALPEIADPFQIGP